MNWLLDNPSDVGLNGCTTFTMENANHFTRMRGPTASSLCAMIREAMGV